MLDQSIVAKLGQELKIAYLHIVREYVEMEVLNNLTRSPLSEQLVFYGGTSLRLGHQSFRFSEDLDFLLIKTTKQDQKELHKILKVVADNNKGVTIEEVYDKKYTLFGLLHITHLILKHPIRLKIEMAKKKNGLRAPYTVLSSPTSIWQPIIYTADLESLHKAKLQAIQNRDAIRDWFDLWYINQRLKIDKRPKKFFPFQTKEFENEIKRLLPRDKWKIINTVISYYG